MAQEAKFPHILIEGRESLAARLRKRLAPQPILISSVGDIEKGISRFRPSSLILEMNNNSDNFQSVERFRAILSDARTEFRIPDSEPVRIACAGSQGSLWHREHGAAMFGPDLEEEEGHILRDDLGRRHFAADLMCALKRLKQVDLIWLAEAFPGLRPDRRTWRYRALVRQARRKLDQLNREEPVSVSIPLLFIHEHRKWPWNSLKRRSRWRVFDQPRSPGGHGGPFRTTTALIRQFAAWCDATKPAHHESVLVKLIGSDPTLHNPLDTPLISSQQLRYAAQAGISAVLLDRRYGIVDALRERDETPQSPLYAV